MLHLQYWKVIGICDTKHSFAQLQKYIYYWDPLRPKLERKPKSDTEQQIVIYPIMSPICPEKNWMR